ncbi:MULTISPECIES: hypothetical protein [Leptolyngbya]|uniref:hypothetical protein n=1 Tax=Leptolyngbya TaxID=47251 RepID=UPI001686F6AF|nr:MULTISPECIES: hypothetical protein [unclassified Leptolyngbya]MBD1855649.1 hypothetical protein [Leptolyngbya sp. FACHB-1624]MBN8564278.1 hypothetical protein [Leptolyngbya sp. UWPOB_LEPTO1]MCY6488628.1 hypothetical protein [Leptolyngbya sp. GGD]
MIRLNQMMMGVSVAVGCLIFGMQTTPQLWHQFQLWRNQGVSCERSTDDGKATFYGQDCL